MKELTVIELSEETGLTRSQIYHLNKKHNFINLNKKINYEDALPIITALTIKKAKKANEKNFRQILNMLILQNFALQKQLNLACEREKTYLSELTSYQKSLAQKTTTIPSIDQGNAQSALENDLNNIDENSRKLIPSENGVRVPNESCNGDNTEKESANETCIQPLPKIFIQNESILSESNMSDGESSGQKNEVIEKKEITQLIPPTPSPNSTQPSLVPKIRKKEANFLSIQTLKNILANKDKSNTNKQNEQAPENEAVADQSKVNKNDHRD
jgi:hypothetical protein